eukprot:628355-Prymnesium_polylepis.1
MASSSYASDIILSLPGLNASVNFAQYAGFVNISLDTVRRDIFYWFNEAELVAPASAPIVLWTNGGPGCSGLLGALTENGPFRAASNGTALLTSPYSWNKRANMLF